MQLTQHQKNKLFKIIPGDDALIVNTEGGFNVHFYQGCSPIMTEQTFESYELALKYFN